jgi:YcxB-like protein
MSRATSSFDAQYSGDAPRRAGEAFRDYQFKRYGLLMIAACVINAVALAFVLWSGAKLGTVLYFLIFVVVIGPIFLVKEYFVGPRIYEIKAKHILATSGRVTVGPESITLPGQRGEISFPWSIIKVVVERPNFFLLVLSPFSSYFVPRQGMPAEVYDLLHSKVNFNAA